MLSINILTFQYFVQTCGFHFQEILSHKSRSGQPPTITNTLSAKFKALWISQSKEPYLPQYLHRLCNSYVKGEDPRRFIPVKVWLYMHLFQKCTCYCRKMLAKFWHDVFYLLNRAAVDWTVSCSAFGFFSVCNYIQTSVADVIISQL